MKKIYCILIVLVFTSITQLFTQNHSIEKVRGTQTNSIGLLNEGNEVVGYYMFFLKDKLDKKTNLFELRILDTDLTKVYEEEMELPAKVILQEVKYNGKTICLKMYDTYRSDKAINNKSFVILKQFDVSGTLVSRKKKELGNYSSQEYMEPRNSDRLGLKELDGKGYLIMVDVRKKRRGYEVMYVPSSKDERIWTFGSEENSSAIETASFLSFNNNIALFYVTRSKKMFSANNTGYIVGYDISTRKKLFETILKDEEHIYFMDKSCYDPSTGETLVLGEYFNKQKSISGSVRGVVLVSIDANGKILNKKLYSWENDFSKYFTINEKGKNENRMRLFFQDIIRSDNGNIYLVSEEYRKSSSGKSIVKGLLTGGAGGGVNIEFGNLQLIRINKDFELEGVKEIQKQKTNIEMPAMSGMFSSWTMLGMVKKMARTDYLFSTKTNDNSSFSLVYLDRAGTIGNFAGAASIIPGEVTPYESGSHYGGMGTRNRNAAIRILTFKNGEYKEDNIDLDEKNCAISIYPSSEGKIMLSHHYIRESRLELNLIKINN